MRAFFAFIAVLIGLGALALYSSAFIVHQNEQVLVLRFGEPQPPITTPGLKWKLPFIDTVEYLDKRILDLDTTEQEVTAADQQRLIDWLRPLWPEVRPEPARVIRVPGQALTDQDQPLVSINSLSSLADLSARLGRDLSPHRFRGNIWVEGWAPFAELDLIGRDIRIGAAILRVEAPIGRCRATGANPETGAQDADTMGALETGYGHTDFGVFARVVQGGAITLGDEVAA